MVIGIMAAMQDEARHALDMLRGPRTLRAAGRDFHRGELFGHDCIIVFSRWGKVAAALSASQLIQNYRPDVILFTGVAGALHEPLSPGDMVIARDLWQHDLDASPLFPPMQIPLTGLTSLPADETWSARLHRAAQRYAAGGLHADCDAALLGEMGITTPRVVRADIATGDQFVASAERRHTIAARIPSAACVEMEGAAVAQVCHDCATPLAVLRIISDRADAHAPAAFTTFLERVAGVMTLGVLREMLSADQPGAAP